MEIKLKAGMVFRVVKSQYIVEIDSLTRPGIWNIIVFDNNENIVNRYDVFEDNIIENIKRKAYIEIRKVGN